MNESNYKIIEKLYPNHTFAIVWDEEWDPCESWQWFEIHRIAFMMGVGWNGSGLESFQVALRKFSCNWQCQQLFLQFIPLLGSGSGGCIKLF